MSIITASFGVSGFIQSETNAPVGKFPTYTLTYVGQLSDVNYSASIYYAKGWDCDVVNGSPSKLVAKIKCELGPDGITPISSSGTYDTILFGFRYETTEKDILHAGIQYVPWISELTETQINILEHCLSDPPTGSLLQAYPAFNTTPYTNGPNSGSTPPTFSSSYAPYTATAGDVVWNMAQYGWRSIPIAVPALMMTATVGTGFTLTGYTSNIWNYYSAADLITAIGVPSNYGAVLTAIQNYFPDPASSTTLGIPMFYGWQKQPPDIQDRGTTTDIRQEYKFGLWPENIYGARL